MMARDARPHSVALRVVGRFGLAVALACGVTGLGGMRADAASYDAARRLETLPSERWMAAATRGVRLAVAQPVAGLPATAGTLAITDRARAGLTPGLRLLALAAGPAREFACAGELRATGAGLGVGASIEAVQLSIADLQQQRHARGAAFAVMGGARVAVGARWEGPLRPGGDVPGGQSQWAARVALPACAVAIERCSSRYGDGARWTLGVRAQLGSALTVALRGGGGDTALVASTRFVGGRLEIALPVASRVGAGIACGLAFEAAGVP